ncbi:MAG: rhamnulokinase, partial [Hungatella sp.]
TAQHTGLPVYAGPTEATAIGNLVAQMIGAGEFQDLEEARTAIFHSFSIQHYEE